MKKLMLGLSALMILLNTGCKQEVYVHVPEAEVEEEVVEDVEVIPFDNTGMTKADLSDYVYMKKESNVYEMSFEELDTFEGTAVVFAGYSDCFWCNQVMPVYNEAARLNVDVPFYYVNVNPPLSKENYEILMKKYKQAKSDAEELYTPLVFGIKDGKVIYGEYGTVSFDTEAQEVFNDEQILEQLDIYNDVVKKVKG